MSNVNKMTNSSDDSEHQSKIVPELATSLKEHLLEVPGAIEYIERLQKTLRKLVKKIRKLKNKITVSNRQSRKY